MLDGVNEACNNIGTRRDEHVICHINVTVEQFLLATTCRYTLASALREDDTFSRLQFSPLSSTLSHWSKTHPPPASVLKPVGAESGIVPNTLDEYFTSDIPCTS